MSDFSQHWLSLNPNGPGGHSIDIRVVGVTFPNPDGSSRQAVIKVIEEAQAISLRREPENEYDPNAIVVETQDGEQCGYIPRDYAQMYAPLLDKLSRSTWPGKVKKILGGYDEKSWGLVISIEIPPDCA